MQVVALGNLLPADSAVDELDSYMYQTVGHQLVAAYAACTGLPLYRRRIQGHSRAQGLSYTTTAGDEVEDLLLLLAFIKEAHPDVEAVASGAIASDYQRLRVESVCSRLGLVSLAYLWHQPQEQLLTDMIANDIEAVLVKVAALGLEPHKHLGKSIRQLQPHLQRLRDRFGCNVCGEGGEYETLTLDCPAFTHGRILLDEWEVVLHSPDSIAAVGVLHPTAFHIQPKQQPSPAELDGSAASSPGPAVPCTSVVEVPADWQPPQQQQQPAGHAQPGSTQQEGGFQAWQTQLKVAVSQQHVHIMCSASAAAETAAGRGFAAADTASALDAALQAVSGQLQQLQGVTAWGLSCFVHLYLADMSHFGAANAAYCRHLPQLNPPSRACVQVPLPRGCPVLLDVLFARHPGRSDSSSSSSSAPAASGHTDIPATGQQQQQPDRRVLHVQSISDWAPSCIGPYSQATSCNGIVHMAGQIPLDPGSMNIVTQLPAAAAAPTAASSNRSHLAWTVAAQVWRALCSCQAVAVAAKSCFASSCLGLTFYLTPEAAAAGAQGLVQAALQEVRRDRALLNQPDRMPPALAAAAVAAAGELAGGDSEGAAAGAQPAPGAGTASGAGCGSGSGSDEGAEGEEPGEGEGPDPALLDEYLQPPDVQQVQDPTVVYLTVPALPRGALLEVQPLLLDLRSAPAAATSSSSSDCDEAGCGAVGTAARADEQLQQAQAALEQLGGRVSVHEPANSTWRRALLQLQQDEGTAAQAVAAAGEWVAAFSSSVRGGGGGGGGSGAQASLRCWYSGDQHSPGAQAGSASALMLLSALLPPKLAGVAQLVPVSGCAASGALAGSCWCVMEALWCCAGAE